MNRFTDIPFSQITCSLSYQIIKSVFWRILSSWTFVLSILSKDVFVIHFWSLFISECSHSIHWISHIFNIIIIQYSQIIHIYFIYPFLFLLSFIESLSITLTQYKLTKINPYCKPQYIIIFKHIIYSYAIKSILSSHSS